MRYLNELNLEELRRVFNENKKLRELVFDEMAEDCNFWIGEYLHCFEHGAVDYSLDVSGYHNYFTVKDFTKFLDGLKKAQKMYCFLADGYNETIEKASALNYKYQYDYYNFSDRNYERIENRLTQLIEELETACYKRIREEYEGCYNDEYLFDYFVTYYIDERLDNGAFYIDENYNLFEHVEFERNYG